MHTQGATAVPALDAIPFSVKHAFMLREEGKRSCKDAVLLCQLKRDGCVAFRGDLDYGSSGGRLA
jgi:hypothetical protein